MSSHTPLGDFLVGIVYISFIFFEPEPINFRFLRRFAKQLQRKTQRIEVHRDAVVSSEVRERFSNDHLLLKKDAEGAECMLSLSESLDDLRSVGEVIFEYHDFAGCGLQDILNGLRSIGFEYLGPQKDQSLHLCRNGFCGKT